jgi:hypothetical protein
MDYPTRYKGHFLLGGTLNDLPFPVQDEGLLVEALAMANRPGFAIDFQVVAPFTNQMTAQIRTVDMQFL